jgi:hypothetical protein
MKILKFIVLISILFFIPAYSYSSNLGELRISLIDGDVQIRTEDTEDWVPASINMPLTGGDRIWVPEGGKTELQSRDGTYLRLGEKSALEILTLDNNSYQFYLTEGRAYANFRGLKDSILQIDTPVSSVRAYDRSHFSIDVSEEGYTDISVYRGSVYVEGEEGKTQIEAGKMLSLREKGYAEISPLGLPDLWEKWNRERDQRLTFRRPPSRYLPGELASYSNDFDQNGRWVYEAGYGYVWTPTVVVSAGWAPYRVGRWVWMGGDYVWISYEPWGWVPYHYGRWIFLGVRGWCWVPPPPGAIFWGPGFVGWVHTPTYVAWVPLAPGEIYYGHGYYGPHSVNVTNVNITNINVTKVVYKNVHINNAVTVIHHDTFIGRKHVDVKTHENPFLTHRISVAGPAIKPERTTRLPVVKEIPPARRPPETIREIHVKELKQKRPLVRNKDASVFRPASPTKALPMTKMERPKPLQERVGKPPTTREGVEKPKESKPVGKRVEKPQEFRPQEKVIEKPREQKPMEKRVEKPQEFRPQEKAIEKPREQKPLEKRVEKPQEFRPKEKTIEKPREQKPVGKRAEKPQEFKPQEKAIEKPREHRPVGKEIEKPGS